MKKAILLIIDGLGDLPTPKTPLQAAKIPNLHKAAKNGITGMLSSVKRFVVPGSDTSHLNILGYDPEIFYPGRGPLEALGLGIDLQEGDVAFRANFATMKNGKIVDRRAGRIDTETATKLASRLSLRIDHVEAIFRNSVEHRGVLVLRGPGLSHFVTGTDIHASSGALEPCSAITSEGDKTADIVNKYTQVIQGILAAAPENQGRSLPANTLLLRGAGTFKRVPSFYDRFGLKAACVAGGALYRGVARYLGMDVFIVPGATGTKTTNLKGKADAAVKAIKGDYDMVFLHVKACDNAGHDGDFIGKKAFLERIDKEMIPILVKSGACLIVTGDHSTPCARKAHSGHEVPLLVSCDQERRDEVGRFDELACMHGGLGHLNGQDIVPLILNLIAKAEKYGS